MDQTEVAVIYHEWDLDPMPKRTTPPRGGLPAASASEDSGVVAELRRWQNHANKDDRMVIGGVGHNLYAMSAALAHQVARPNSKPPAMDTILSFLIHFGLERLQARPDVQRIQRARDQILTSSLGSEAMTWFNNFDLIIRCGHDGRRPKTWVRVREEDRNANGVLAESLGLDMSKTAILAICSVLVDAPLPEVDHAFLQDVLTDFLHQLARRASEAAQRALASEGPTRLRSPGPRRSFADICATVERNP